MRIVQVSSYYPPHLGGQEVAVQELAIQLAKLGHEVEVVTSDLGANRGVEIEGGVRVTRLRSWEFGHTAVIWTLFIWILRNVGRRTIVHVHAGQVYTPEVVWLASKLKRFNYIIHMHIDPVASGRVGKVLPIYKRLLLHRVMRAAHTVAVLNEEHWRRVIDIPRINAKVVIFSNGVRSDFFSVSRTSDQSISPQLLFAGRLSPQKNLNALLRALSTLGDNVSLHVIGEGECRHDLEVAASNLGLDNVIFHGQMSRDSIKQYYSKCHAFVLPSLYEAQPIALLEAMASRIPVIASDVIGIGSYASDCAILVEPNPTGIAHGLIQFCAMSEQARQELACRAFERVKGQRWDVLIESYLRLYEEVQETH